MAKISAHGSIIFTAVKQGIEKPDSGFTDFTFYKRLMSDGHILFRQTAAWKDLKDAYYSGSKCQDWGWKLYKKYIKEEWSDPVKRAEHIKTLRELYISKGWTIED